MLDDEVAFFNANRADWVEKYKDRVALVKGSELIGIFDNEEAALREGARRYGLQSFLVRRVTAQDTPVNVPALAFGLIRADSACTNDGTGTGA